MKFEIDKVYTNSLGAKVALLYRTGNNLAFIGAMGVYYTDLEGQCADPGKSVQPPLKFEIGKHYTTKLGHKVRLDAIVQGRLVFKAAEHAYRTTMDGKSVWGHMDVVKEWEEPRPQLKLEVGKYYKTRDGLKAVVTAIHNWRDAVEATVYNSNGSKAERNFKIDGRWALGVQDDPIDLVEEWKESQIKLEVGKYYKTRSGSKVRVVEIRERSLAHTPVTLEVYIDKAVFTRACPLNGQWLLRNEEHPFDIVEEWKEPTLKLEVGKTYRTRNGLKALITVIHDWRSAANQPVEATVYHKNGAELKRTYKLDGSWTLGIKEDPLDLVEEWKEPTLKLEVGKYYKTRAGYRAQVVNIGKPVVSHNVVIITFEQATPVTRTYTPKGQWAMNLNESSLDLVAEWTEPKVEKSTILEEGDIVIATTRSGRKVVRVFAGYFAGEPTVYKDGYFEGQPAGNWLSVTMLKKGKDA